MNFLQSWPIAWPGSPWHGKSTKFPFFPDILEQCCPAHLGPWQGCSILAPSKMAATSHHVAALFPK